MACSVLRNAPPTGYPIEIFEGNVESKFLCVHCHLILKDPLQVQCGHRICKECIKYILSVNDGDNVLCPSCQEEGEVNECSVLKLEQAFPDNSIRREMGKLSVKCSAPDCEWTGSLKDYESHHYKCCSLSSLCHENVTGQTSYKMTIRTHEKNQSVFEQALHADRFQSNESDAASYSRQNNDGVHAPSASVVTNSMNPIEVQDATTELKNVRKAVPPSWNSSTLKELESLRIQPRIRIQVAESPITKMKDYADGSGPLDLRSDDSANHPAPVNSSATPLLNSVLDTDAISDHTPSLPLAGGYQRSVSAAQGFAAQQGPGGRQGGPSSLQGPAAGQIPMANSAASAPQLGAQSSQDDTIRIKTIGPNGTREVHIVGASKFVHGVQFGDNNVMHVNSASQARAMGAELLHGQAVAQRRAAARAPTSAAGVVRPKVQIVVPNRQVDDDILRKVYDKIPKDWMAVGRRLGLTDYKLASLQIDYQLQGVNETSYWMLSAWREQAGQNATYQALAKALVESKRADVAKLLSSTPQS